MGNSVTLRDVAKLAGVSLGTASQALSNKSNVAPDTRNKVLEAAASLGYQVQIRIPSPITTQLSVVGMLVKQDSNVPLPMNPFYSHVLAGVEHECQRQNLSLMYGSVMVDRVNRPISFPPMLLDQRTDGIIVVGTFFQDVLDQIRQVANEKPIVLVDAYAPEQPFDSIVTDNINGAYAAVKYLVELGHQHIGLLGSTHDAYPSIRERRKGYTRALKYCGIEAFYMEDSTLNREGGYDAAIKLLQRSPEVTALFCCNDEVAIGAMNAVQDMGKVVPDDVSIIGFDNIDLAQEVKPALSTVHIDKVLMGVLAVRQLRDRAENLSRPAITTSLSTHLIVRESVQSLVK